jgi:hypothetical protein
MGWEPIQERADPDIAGQPERHQKIPEPTEPRIVPSNRRLQFDGPHFSASAIRLIHLFIMSLGFLRLITAFSLGAKAPNRQSGCDNPGLQRAELFKVETHR